jgi:glycosyltransferase involved in cell wall biosynthesis
LRIGIDYLPATTHAPGVGRYARELVRALVRLDDRPDLALYDVGRRPPLDVGAPPVVDEASLGLAIGDRRVTRVRADRSRRLLAALPFALGAADRALGGVDLFHHVLLDPPPVARALETIAVSEMPRAESDADRRLAHVLARMRAVFVFSAATREKLVSRYGLARDRIHPVPVGCEHWRRALVDLPPRTGVPLILVLGALRTERRHAAILAVAERLATRGVETRLHWIGRAGPALDDLRRAVESSPMRARIRWDATRPESEMPALVAGASVLVHLNDAEETPVTPLEAFAVGVPVVASRLAPFEESLGGLADLLDNAEIVREPERLDAALERAIASARDEGECAARMLHARASSWERCAEATLAVWRAVLDRSREA